MRGPRCRWAVSKIKFRGHMFQILRKYHNDIRYICEMLFLVEIVCIPSCHFSANTVSAHYWSQGGPLPNLYEPMYISCVCIKRHIYSVKYKAQTNTYLYYHIKQIGQSFHVKLRKLHWQYAWVTNGTATLRNKAPLRTIHDFRYHHMLSRLMSYRP